MSGLLFKAEFLPVHGGRRKPGGFNPNGAKGRPEYFTVKTIP